MILRIFFFFLLLYDLEVRLLIENDFELLYLFFFSGSQFLKGIYEDLETHNFLVLLVYKDNKLGRLRYIQSGFF